MTRRFPVIAKELGPFMFTITFTAKSRLEFSRGKSLKLPA
jgi:hypothetical protein